MRAYLLGLICLLALATTTFATDPQPRSVSTTGEATVYVTPDKVVVTFGIETFNSELDGATAANKAAAATFVKAIKDLGIEEKDIQTDMLQVEIRYHTDSARHNQIEGYFARRSYSIKVRDTKLFEKLVETGLKQGANQLQSVLFQTTELRKYRDQARQMAIKAAKEKALLLAKELECTIGKPRSISEGYGGSYFGRGSWGGNYNNMAQNVMQAMPAGPSESETLPLGQIAVPASVSVSFDLAD